jgi:hypothetical protein
MGEEAGAMAYVMVDVESDGPIPRDYSMICVGAVLVQEGLRETFYGRLRPISEQWIPEALAVSGFSRAETLSFDDPKTVMETFAYWIAKNVKGRALFISDNNGFDFAFVSWYFWHFTGANPFGHSSTNLGSLYKDWSRTPSRTSSTCARPHTPITRSMMPRATPKRCWR